jgi:hypothetical protein
MNPSISIENIGAIEEFSYELGAPGLKILRGKNGSGKTTITRVIQMALGEPVDIKPTKRDGAARGTATVAGKTIKIMKTTREEGEITVEGLGELNIYDLHSPAYKNATTRDRHRISTLVRLTGTKALPSMFHELIDRETFERIVTADALQTNDLVEMAARVKRAFEKEALRLESLEQTAMANALAQTKVAESVDVNAPHDATELQSALETAISEKAAEVAKHEDMDRRFKEAQTAAVRADEAKERLDAIGGGITVAEAETRIDAAAESVALVLAQVNRLQEKLDAAKQTLREVQATRDAAVLARSVAKREESLHIELKAAIDAGNVEGPTERELEHQSEEVSAAHFQVEAAKQAITKGVQVREAMKAKDRADEHQEEAKVLAKEARRLRGAATDTANVLTKAISRLHDCPLKVKLTEEWDARLSVATERSDDEYFEDLSDGTRWLYVVRIAAASRKLIVLSQAAYGELAESYRALLDKLAKENGCWIITAEALDCELHGVSYGADDEGKKFN